MRPRNALDDGEPQARAAAPAARLVEAREGALEALHFGGRHSGPAVHDVDLCVGAVAARGDQCRRSRPGKPRGAAGPVDAAGRMGVTVDITYQLAGDQVFFEQNHYWVALKRRAEDVWLVAMAPIDPLQHVPMQWTEGCSGEAILVPLFTYILTPDPAGQFLFGCGLGAQILADTSRTRLKHVAPKQLHVVAAPAPAEAAGATRVLAGVAFRYAK